MVYGQESVIAIAVGLPVWLLVAHLIGQLARRLLRGRVRLSTSSTTVIAALGISVGMLVAGLVFTDIHPWSPAAIVLAIGVATALLALFATLAARLQPPRPAEPIEKLIRRGESDRVELKSSARWNPHTKAPPSLPTPSTDTPTRHLPSSRNLANSTAHPGVRARPSPGSRWPAPAPDPWSGLTVAIRTYETHPPE